MYDPTRGYPRAVPYVLYRDPAAAARWITADQPWGLRQAVVADPEEQRWELTQHIRDVAPADWGAQQIAPLPG